MTTYFGGIRRAPSSRIVSPFSIGFSAMWQARAAYSSGRPSLGGGGPRSPRARRAPWGGAEPGRVRHLLAERRARLLGEAGQQRGVEQARCDRADPDAEPREVARR